MTWSIHFTSTAYRDLENIHSYITIQLSSPDTAKKLTRKIFEKIRSLATFPERYKIFQNRFEISEVIRVMPVENYLVFYLLNKALKKIIIIRIMYAGRDLDKQLKPYLFHERQE